MESLAEQLTPVSRLTRDLKAASVSLSKEEARYLVDAYYSLQEYRKASGNQVLALTKSGEPCEVIKWLNGNTETLESQIKRALDAWSGANALGQWARSIVGIGPVIASGLLAHIDISKAPTVGHIWNFAGLNASTKWNKGEKRPWNASLKTLCWKIGESFVKVSNNEDDVYGKLYKQRKAIEIAKNDQMGNTEQASEILKAKRISKDTDAYAAYSTGKLPPAHIQSRAKRWAVKIFLSHYHHVAYNLQYGDNPPKPFAIEHLGHAHFIAVPNWPIGIKPEDVKEPGFQSEPSYRIES